MTNQTYKVFNYTDSLFASFNEFQNKKEANQFIKEFRSKYNEQGYYRTNYGEKISPKHIDLLAIPSNFNPFKF